MTRPRRFGSQSAFVSVKIISKIFSAARFSWFDPGWLRSLAAKSSFKRFFTNGFIMRTECSFL
jgi:hypothetical protein